MGPLNAEGTSISKLMEEFPSNFGSSTSHNTRAPREKENGIHCHFTERSIKKMEVPWDCSWKSMWNQYWCCWCGDWSRKCSLLWSIFNLKFLDHMFVLLLFSFELECTCFPFKSSILIPTFISPNCNAHECNYAEDEHS